jgi:hypothetical protein
MPGVAEMTNNRTPLFIATMLFICCVSGRAADSTRSEEILAHHLDAIATGPTRTEFKARVVEGTAIYKILAGGTGSIEGKGVVASETNRTRFLFKVVANTYHGEQFICDGSHVDVAATYSDKSRSELATFIRGQDAPIREGLLGGVLTTAWPLLRSDASKRLTFEGLKKVGEKELLTFRYHPKKSSDLEILIYLDPLSFRHVRTTYHADQAAPISFNDVQSARQMPTRYLLTEEFDQFQTTDGITLPTRYILRFRSEQQVLTKEVEWDITVGKVLNNISMDPRNFEIK